MDKLMEEYISNLDLGCDHRYTGDKLVGSSLTVKDKVIHSVFFNLA